MAQMMSKMGCHRRLELCSPAKSLRLRVCHSFCNPRVTVAFLIAATGAEMAFLSLSFNSATFTLPRQEPLCPYPEPVEGHLFFPLLSAVSVIPLHFISSTASATHTCRWYHSALSFPQAPFNQPQVFPAQSNRQQKHAPNPCAYCIGRQLFSSCPFLSSTLALLAVGSRRSIQPVSISFRLAFIPLASHTQGSQLSYLLKSLLMRLF